MQVHILKSQISDNFFYLIRDPNGDACLVDPIDGDYAVEVIQQNGYRLQSIVNTHFHPDHIGGNPAVLKAFPKAELVSGKGDAGQIQEMSGRAVDRLVSDGDRFAIGELVSHIRVTPGHTPGHISLQIEKHLFSGDTIFVAGAGNCRFGGDPGELFQTFHRVLRRLDPAIRFYPGHDYSQRNLEFALSIEPELEAARAELNVRQNAEPSSEKVPLRITTLGEERSFNPFMRYDDPSLAEALRDQHEAILEEERTRSASDAESVFRTLRRLRNDW